MIYYEDYYIDSSGKQIYEPKTSAVTPVVLYADDPYANSAIEKMRLNLTLEEIYNLSVYGELKLDVIEKNQTYLSKAEIAALYEMSYEELYAAYIALVYAAETYGAAGGETTGTTTSAAAPETVVTTAETTTVADKTEIIYDKTDITTGADKTENATSIADKTEIIVTEQITGMGDKTDIVVTTAYPDKTETTTTITSDTSVKTTAETTVITSTTTTTPPETTFSGTVDGDVIIVTTDPK